VILKYSKPCKCRSQVDGLVVTNTTIRRPAELRRSPKLIHQEGGLSGPPLKKLSTETIRQVYQHTGGKVPIIGVGGVETGIDAFDKIVAGASAVQLYTTMAYVGPPVVREVKKELAMVLAYNGFTNVQEAVGADHNPALKIKRIRPKQPPKDKEQTAPKIVS